MMNCFALACNDFCLKVSLKKTNVLGQGTSMTTSTEHQLDNVHEVTYLEMTVTDYSSVSKKLDGYIGNAAMTLSNLTERIFCNRRLFSKTFDISFKANISITPDEGFGRDQVKACERENLWFYYRENADLWS